MTDITLIIDPVLRLLVAAIVLYRNQSSTAVRVTWLLVVLMVPLLGAVLYLMFGEVWRQQGRFIRFKETHDAVVNGVHQHRQAVPQADTLSDSVLSTAKVLTEYTGFPLREGNRWQLYSDSDKSIHQLVADIDASTHSCHLLFYIWLDDHSGNKVAQALIEASQRGIECRVIVDGLGSIRFLNSTLIKKMKMANVEVTSALPIGRFITRADHRNHRKIAVIDGNIGWTGSQNIADAAFAIKPKFAPWVDVMIRIQGPVVHDLQALFFEGWLIENDGNISNYLTPLPDGYEEGIPMQLYGTGPYMDFKIIRQLMIASMFTAKKELILTTPYFVPDEATITALCGISRSGVRVVLIVPKKNDSRLVAFASHSFYSDLLHAGVEIFEYRPGLLHSKTVTIDNQISSIDSSNLDRRSFELNFESGLSIPDPQFTQTLRSQQQRYIDNADMISLEDWLSRPWYRRLTENLARLLAPVL